MRPVLALFFLVAGAAWGTDRSTCRKAFAAEFAPGGELRISVRSGDVEVIGSDSAEVRVTCGMKQRERSGEVRIEFDSAGTRRELRVRGGPDGDFHLRIHIPRETHLMVRVPAGDLSISGVKGNKDVKLRAGDLEIEVGDPGEYASVKASVTAGDLQAPAFGVSKGGLFRSFKKTQPRGKYRLNASLWAGDLTLR